MLEKLITYFNGSRFVLVTDSIYKITPFLKHLEKNYADDKEAKNALIDTVIQILQQHKDKS